VSQISIQERHTPGGELLVAPHGRTACRQPRRPGRASNAASASGTSYPRR
jgi:hypothetical protein